MGDEWVRVVFPAARAVQVDDGVLGLTNEAFIVQRGTHVFDLGTPLNFTPPRITQAIAGTTQTNPFILTFTQNAAPQETAAPVQEASPQVSGRKPSRPRRRPRKTPR